MNNWYRAVKDEKARIEAAWDEYQEQRGEQYRLLGHATKDAEFEARCDDLWEIGRSIFAKPAHTFEGMTVKLRAGERLGLEEFADRNEAFLSIAADIKRLAASGRQLA